MPHDPQIPTTWLWEEIARRYGATEAEALRLAFNARMTAYQHHQLLEKYRTDIPQLQARIALAERHGKQQALIRNYERQIAHRRSRLESGWSNESAGKEQQDATD